MMQIVLVGLGAGAAAALLFATALAGAPLISGTTISVTLVYLRTLLFYLAPLPILIAALGWNHWAGLVAGLVAATSLGLVIGFYLFSAFMIGVALPAWWLAYLSLLARPVAANGSPTLEWYPIGRLLLWAALISAVLVIVAVPYFGTDKEAFQAALRSIFERAFRSPMPVNAPADIDRVIDLLVSALPLALAGLITLLSMLNLWIAGRVVRVSGRLARPWPDLSMLTLPPLTPGLLALAIAGMFLPGIASVLSGIVAGSLMMAYALVGFAVLHAVTRGLDYRAMALAGTYVAVILFFWPLLALALLGLADSAFLIRARVTAKRARPPNSPPT